MSYKRKRRTFGTAAGRPFKRMRGVWGALPAPVVYNVRRRARKNYALRRRNLSTLGFLGIEKKFYDTSLVSTAFATSSDGSGGMLDPSASVMISAPSQGDSESQRDGRQISMLYVEIVGIIEMDNFGAATSIDGCNVYLACVLDTQTNAAQMLSQNCFKNGSANAVLGTSMLRNLLYGKRFRILKQKTFVLNPETITFEAGPTYTTHGKTFPFRWFIPLKGMRVNFNSGTTADVANVVDNSIHMVGYANRIASVAPRISYQARLRYMG